MERFEKIQYLNQILLEEMPEYRGQASRFPQEDTAQRRLLRSLMNVRSPRPLDQRFLQVQDELLSAEREARGVVDAETLSEVPGHPGLALWQGDITRLKADAIVDADNAALLGCFCPCHGCIDNAIHTYAGVQLRLACAALMQAQGREEEPGGAKLTPAFNLPCRYVLHTVGPIVCGQLTLREEAQLSSCYRACLALAEQNHIRSVAFCCISTGEYRFPNDRAAQLAVRTVKDYQAHARSSIEVIFNVFKEIDYQLYRSLLGADRAAEG